MAHVAKKHERAISTTSDGSDGGDGSEGGSVTPGRAIWSGSISFGLLQIPVTLYPAERRSEEIHFRQLDKHDLSPIRYDRVNATTGKPVEWKDIVKGYEYEPDTFVVLDPEEVKQANAKATQTVDIQDFVHAEQIDPAHFETPYYVVPQKRAAKAYVLLREALKKKRAVAVATVVLRTKEHLAALLPVGDAIMLEVLRFGHELRKPKDMPLPGKDPSIGQRELAMAEQLIDGMMTDFDPSKYRDRFHAEVMKMIEEKAKTGTIKSKAAIARGEVPMNVVDLLDLLKKSVAANGKASRVNDGNGEPAKKPGPKKASRRVGKKHEAA